MSSNTVHNRQTYIGLPVTFAVCSNDPGRVSANSIRNLAQLGSEDRLLIVFDADDEPRMAAIARELRGRGLGVMFSGPSRGLSEARNAAIQAAGTRYLVFLDDDVTVSRSAVEDLRAAFAAGGHIVGARLDPGPGIDLSKWYISHSQFHYLGIHRQDVAGKTWGACMGFDLNFVRERGLRFRIELGRRGQSLISGDDTTFVSECVQLQAREIFLEHTRVHHHVAPSRLTLACILRRAFWQGRSEVRRSNSYRGALKEWKRNTYGWHQTPLRTFGLAVLYQTAVILGIGVEWAGSNSNALRSETALERPPELNGDQGRESISRVHQRVEPAA